MQDPETRCVADAGGIPHNPRLPVLTYPGAGSSDPEAVEAMFHHNG